MKKETIIAPARENDRLFYLVWKSDYSEENEKEIERLEKEHEKVYLDLYDSLIKGKIDCFWWDNAGLRHIFTKSVRKGITVQKSTLYYENGNAIPVSHENINTFDDMRDLIPQNETSIEYRIY